MGLGFGTVIARVIFFLWPRVLAFERLVVVSEQGWLSSSFLWRWISAQDDGISGKINNSDTFGWLSYESVRVIDLTTTNINKKAKLLPSSTHDSK